MALPYMGSKRKLAPKIIQFIKEKNPNATHFYDLFGGGGAVSFEAQKHFENVHYNELNTGVVELLKKLRDEGVTDEFYKWVDREKFNKHKNDDTWYGGLLQTCWSFGSNQKDYLYGEKIENDKRLLHEIVANQCQDSRDTFFERHGISIEFELIEDISINNSRLKLQRLFSNLSKELKENIKGFCIVDKNVRKIVEDLERIETLKRLGAESMTILDFGSRVQSLQFPRNPRQLQHLHITNLSYEQVPINKLVENTVIYLDPPYKNTAKYQNDMDHEALYNWVINCPYKVYVSSYEFDLPCVLEMEHRSTLSANNNSKKVVEKLFCNR